jgi:hypothetical protein
MAAIEIVITIVMAIVFLPAFSMIGTLIKAAVAVVFFRTCLAAWHRFFRY